MRVGNWITIVFLFVGAVIAGRWAGSAGSDRSAKAPTEIARSASPDDNTSPTTQVAQTARGEAWADRLVRGELASLSADLLALDRDERIDACLEVIAALDGSTLLSVVETYYSEEDSEGIDEWLFEHVSEVAPLAFMARWAEVDPDGMVNYITGRMARLPIDDEGESVTSGLGFYAVLVLANTDPHRALELSLKMDKDSLSGDFAQQIALAGLLARDPLGALQLAIERPITYGESLFILATSNTDFDALLPTVLAMKHKDRREDYLEALIGTWSEIDPAALFAVADRFPDDESRDALLEQVFRTWGERDAQAASLAIASVPGDQRERLAIELAEGWVETDPTAALRWAEENLSAEQHGAVFEIAAENWSAAAAIEYLEANERLGRKNFVRAVRIANRFIKEDPVAALEWLAQSTWNDPEMTFQMDGSKAGEGVAIQGIKAVERALEIAPAGNFRLQMIGRALDSVAYENPIAAQELAAHLEGEDRASALRGIALGWAEREPGKAADWLQTNGDPDSVNTAMARWAYDDSLGASEYINEQMQAGESRDQAIISLVRQINELDPDSAMAWAEAVDDPANYQTAQDALQPRVADAPNSPLLQERLGRMREVTLQMQESESERVQAPRNRRHDPSTRE